MAMVEFPSSSDKPLPSSTCFPSPPLQWSRNKRLRSPPSPFRRSPPSPFRRFPHTHPSETTPATPNSTPLEQDSRSGSDKPDGKNPPTTPTEPEPHPSLRSRDENRRSAPAEKKSKKKEKLGLWISLSRYEIEEDYYSITGSRLPRRPKRRHSSALDKVFPGEWLPNTVTMEMYKAHAPNERRRRWEL